MPLRQQSMKLDFSKVSSECQEVDCLFLQGPSLGSTSLPLKDAISYRVALLPRNWPKALGIHEGACSGHTELSRYIAVNTPQTLSKRLVHSNLPTLRIFLRSDLSHCFYMIRTPGSKIRNQNVHLLVKKKIRWGPREMLREILPKQWWNLNEIIQPVLQCSPHCW